MTRKYKVEEGRYYTTGDTWVYRTDRGRILFGITDYAQQMLKSIEYLNLPEPGETAAKGEALGEVESKKALSELMCPFNCEVVEVNENAVDSPDVLNKDPYGTGWILELACEDYNTSVSGLMDAREYCEYRS